VFCDSHKSIDVLTGVASLRLHAWHVLYLKLLAVISVSARELKAADNGVLTLTKADEAQQVASAAADMKAQPSPAGPSVSLAARSDILEQQFSAQSELAYAQQVELTNGRCGKKSASCVVCWTIAR
jgi:hypothetical protein